MPNHRCALSYPITCRSSDLTIYSNTGMMCCTLIENLSMIAQVPELPHLNLPKQPRRTTRRTVLRAVCASDRERVGDCVGPLTSHQLYCVSLTQVKPSLFACPFYFVARNREGKQNFDCACADLYCLFVAFGVVLFLGCLFCFSYSPPSSPLLCYHP